MSDEHPTTLCSDCCEPMDARARFCPHCSHMQWRLAWPRLAAGIAPMVLIAAVMMVWVGRMERAFYPPARPAYAGQIKVAESRMEFGQSPEGPVVMVVGMLRNDSDIPWKEVSLQAEFFGPKSALIDVDAKDYHLANIQPHGELAFKLRGPADLPRESYARYEVTVASARDARSPF